MKKILIYILLFIFGIGVVFAGYYNYNRIGKNWDANVSISNSANDIFYLSGRLDLEDSRTSKYQNGYRGQITGKIKSDLFGNFKIENKLELKYKQDYDSSYNCGSGEKPLEIYSISGSLLSSAEGGLNAWGRMRVDHNHSYFCSNQYIYLKLFSNTLGEKEIGNGTTQNNLIDNFGKQEISVSGIVRLKGKTDRHIENRGDGKFNNLGVFVSSKALIKRNLNKNIFKLFNTYSKINKIEKDSTTLLDFNSPPIINKTYGEKFFLYDYSGKSDKNIDFQGTGDYPNKGEYLKIGNNGTSEIEINGKNTVIVKSGNIYIKSNLYNKNDNNSILILVAKRDKNTGKGGNIYIDPDVTNIDAVLIADGSLLSMGGNKILTVDSGTVNVLRKQLLIYGSILSSNVVGTDDIPYGADYYEKPGYTPNKDNIYDLGNLRSFNLNYGSGSLDSNKLVPIDGNGGFKEYAWACKKQWYEDDPCGSSNLRSSTKRNPLIIEYNSNIKNLNPFILQNN